MRSPDLSQAKSPPAAQSNPSFVNKADISLPFDAKARHIGIHGARGTGKTSYFACLYGQRATEGVGVKFGDDASLDHLKAVWKLLETGNASDATALTLPTILNLAISVKGVAWNVSTRDYAGALIQRTETGVPELKNDVKNWLKSCHAILLFVNIDSQLDGDETFLKDRHDEIDLLLTELRKLSPTGNTIGRPLALLLTKWDIRGNISQDIEGEREEAVKYLQTRPALKQIADALKNWGDRVEVFPVSAFGDNRDGNKPLADGPRPFGLHAPLAWAVQKSDEMLLAQAMKEADEHAAPGLWWWKRRYGAAASCFLDLIQNKGVNKGPTYDVAKRQLDTWSSKHIKRRVWQSVLIFALLLLVVGFGFSWHESHIYQKTLGILGDSTATPEQVNSQCDQFLATWNPLAGWRRHKEDIDLKWREFREQRETREYNTLSAYRHRNDAPEAASDRASRAREFLGRWPSSSRAAEVSHWINDDSNLAEEHKENTRFETEYRGLLGTLTKLGDKYDKLIAECDRFLKDFPVNKFAKKVALIDDVKKKRSSYDEARLEQEWAEVVNFDRQNPNNFDEIIRRAEDYSNKPTARYREQARNLVLRTQIRWDRTEYDKVRDATREAKDADSILAAEQVARKYGRGALRLRKGEEAVQRWLNWLEGFKEEKDYYFTIRAVQFPKDTELSNGRAAKVYGTFGSSTFDTGWSTASDNPQLDRKVGPVRFKWGGSDSLKVTVERQYGVTALYYINPGSNYRATGNSDEGDRFLLGKLNGPFAVTYNRTQVIVFLECPEAAAPSLPPYPER